MNEPVVKARMLRLLGVLHVERHLAEGDVFSRGDVDLACENGIGLRGMVHNHGDDDSIGIRQLVAGRIHVPVVGVSFEDGALVAVLCQNPGVQGREPQGLFGAGIPVRLVLVGQQLGPFGFVVLFQFGGQVGLRGVLLMELLQIVGRLDHEVVAGNPGVQGGDEEAVRLAERQLKGEVVDNLQLRRVKQGIALCVELTRKRFLDVRIPVNILKREANVFRGHRLTIGPLQPIANLEAGRSCSHLSVKTR